MAGERTGEVEHRIRITKETPTFAGKMHVGDILVVSTVNARRPGSKHNTICMLPPEAFEFVVDGVAETEDDPLAGIGINLKELGL